MASTHKLIYQGSVVTKRFRSWGRGEHRREWVMLSHLQQHAPGLAADPVAADLGAQPPEVVMTFVAGQPMHGVIEGGRMAALATALQTLWAVPAQGLPDEFAWTNDLHYARRLTDGPRPSEGVLGDAYQEAERWWSTADPARLQTPPPRPVVGQRDGNLANYLSDGATVRIVDFEDAAVVDPADELGLIVEHVSTRQLDPDRLLEQFDVDQDRLLAARRVWAMYWLARLLPGQTGERRNPPGSAELQARRLLTLLAT